MTTIKRTKRGFKISRTPCLVCGEPPFGDEYACGHRQQLLTWPKIGSTIRVMVDGRPERFPVSQPCADKHAGHWYCITHKKHFAHQFAKDTHIHNGTHEMVWCCDEHGPEVDPKWA